MKTKVVLFDFDSERVIKDLSRTYRLFVQKVLVDVPARGSLADLVLLKDQLAEEERQSWDGRAQATKNFRDSEEYKKLRYTMFDENKRKNGGKILCAYCGRECNRIHEDANQATIDHIVPLSEGGQGLDRKNLIVCCRRCNRAKRYFKGSVSEYKKIRTEKRLKEEKEG